MGNYNSIVSCSGPNPNALGWEHKFSADNWTIQEELFEADHCVVGSIHK